MTDIAYLLLYLGIAAILVFVANLRGMSGFRLWLDRAANAKAGNLSEAKRISMLGETRKVRSLAGRTVHHVTIGVRLLSTGLVIALLMVIDGRVGIGPGTFVPEGYETEALWGALILAFFYLFFIWGYRLVRDDHLLHVPTIFQGRRTFDLRTLIRIEDDGAYMLRLYFEDGRRTEILKYVEGRAAFMNELEEYASSAQRQKSGEPVEFPTGNGI